MNDVYESSESKLEILKLGFENQVQYLRMMSDVDLKIFSGYTTAQLILASWLTKYPVSNWKLKGGLLLVDCAFTVLAINAFRVNQLRRSEAVGILRNLCEALGFTVIGVFLPEKAIQESVPTRPWTWLYYITVIFSAVGVGIIILSL